MRKAPKGLSLALVDETNDTNECSARLRPEATARTIRRRRMNTVEARRARPQPHSRDEPRRGEQQSETDEIQHDSTMPVADGLVR